MSQAIEPVRAEIGAKVSRPKVLSGNVVDHMNLIRQTVAERVEEKLEEPEKIEPKPVIEKVKAIIVEQDRIIEDEQPIKVVEILQPQTPEQTRRRPDRGGR